MQNLSILKIKGLYTTNNELSEVPNGSLQDCNNVVLTNDSILEPRRGFKIYGNAMGVSATTDVAKQLLVYKKRILRHYSNKLEYDNGTGTFTPFAGNYSEVVEGIRIKGIESNSNFYFTTSDGIKKISVKDPSGFSPNAGFITNAGGIKALDLNGSLNPQEGFLTQNSKVAYRLVWGIKDVNGNLILGSPSERLVISNPLIILLIKDFNNLLANLDIASDASAGDELSDGDYVNTFKIPASFSSSASLLYTGLIGLNSKLENDLNTIGSPTFTRTLQQAEITANTGRLIFSSSMPFWLSIGQTIQVSDLPAPFAGLNGNRVVTNITTTTIPNDTIEFAFTGTITAPASTTGTVRLYEFLAIPQPSAPSVSPTTTELEALQNYYTAMVNLLLAQPSTKIEDASIFAENATTTSSTVNLEFTIPEEITTAYFYQIYRTAVVHADGAVTLDDIDPGDEMGLVIEANPTAQQIIDKEVILQDITPDSFRGTNLYTNPQSGEGILQSNDTPPLALDIASFRGSTFYANTSTKYRLLINLVGVSNFTSGVSNIIITDGTTTNTLTFVSPVAEVTTVTTVADVATNLASKYFYLYSGRDINKYYVWYMVRIPGVEESTSVVTVADVSGSLGGNYFYINSANDTIEYYIWYQVNVPAVQEVTDVTTVADVAGSLNNKYWFINEPGTGNGYYVWYNVAGGGVDPGPFGSSVGVQVNIATNDTATTVATATASAFSAITAYSVSQLGSTLTFTNTVGGSVADATAQTSGFTVVTTTQGVNQFFIGSDPAIPGKVGIKVIVDENSSDVVVANNTVASLASITSFNSSNIGNTITITNNVNGVTTDSSAETSGFTVTTLIQGVDDVFVGTDPLISGKVGIPIIVDQNDSANNVALATRNKLNQYSDFEITGATNNVIITDIDAGVTTDATAQTSGFTITINTQGDGEDPSNGKVLLSDASTPAQQVDETARSLVKVINNINGGIIYASYTSGPTDVPGQMLFYSRLPSGDKFYISSSDPNILTSFNPNLNQSIAITNISVANPTIVTTASPHNFSTGDTVIINSTDSTPVINGDYTITVLSPTTFSVPVNVTVAGTTGNVAGDSTQGDNEAFSNRIYYSKFQQPEAVPLVNFIDVGPRDSTIFRIVPLRDGLFVFKEEGVYRISGESATTGFVAVLFDNTTTIKAPDSAVTLNNQIFYFSDNGITSVTDTGSEIISRDIENILLPLVLSPNFSSASFGVSYESDKSYMFWTIRDLEDTRAQICYRFNYLTRAWTKWEIAKTCGILNSSQDKLYLGAADTNFIEVERKEFRRQDFADREYVRDLLVNSVVDNVVNIGDSTNVHVGDSLVQEQYLTIYKYNQLLIKLDSDHNVGDHNYYALLQASQGFDLRNSLDNLATKLDNDPGIADNDYLSAISGYTSSFPDTQEAFNVITDKLNNDGGLAYNNYPTSVGTVFYEAIIDVVNTVTNRVTLNLTLPLIAGNVTIYNSFEVSTKWNVQSFGDSELYKQVSEAKIVFKRTNFSSGTISYYTDISNSKEDVEFSLYGNGTFGNDVFGENIFGGNGDRRPIRTFVPRNKQRSRFLQMQISHKKAREKMTILGYSMDFKTYSAKAYSK